MTINHKNLSLDEYQDSAKSTAIYPSQAKYIYTSLGMAGESGEVCKLLIKPLQDVKKPNKLIKEILATLKEYCEVAAKVEKLKKDIRKKRELATEANLAELEAVVENLDASVVRLLIDETGDVLWYVANMASDIDISLSSIGLLNKQKLKERSAANQIADHK